MLTPSCSSNAGSEGQTGAGGASSSSSSSSAGGGGSDCGDTASAPGDCGSCGHSCLGGSCVAGACQPVLLGEGPKSALALAIDATHVYWSAGTSVLSVPVGGGAVTTLVSGEGDITGVAIDATTLYWAERGSSGLPGKIRRSPLAGGAPIDLVLNQAQPSWVIVDASAIYWNATGTILKASKDGSNPTQLAQGGAVTGMTSDASTLYWSDSTGSLWSVPKAGGQTFEIASNLPEPRGVAVDEANIYFADSTLRLVSKVPKGGGAQTLLGVSPKYPTRVVVDATYAYWIDGSGEIDRASIVGETAPTEGERLASGLAGPKAIAQDASALYWLQDDGAVMKLAK